MQFVRKKQLGWFAEITGEPTDTEYSHVLMDRDEYGRMLQYIGEKERAVTEARDGAANAVAYANWNAREALARAEKEAGERLQAIQWELETAQQELGEVRQELEAEKAESAYQRARNENLLRISRERANAERGLRPKKTRPGYVVLFSEEKDFPYREGKKLYKARLWETTLQSPYPAEFAETVLRRQLEEDLFSEEGEQLSVELGITGRYPYGYENMRAEMNLSSQNPLFQGNVVLTGLQRLKRNFRSGYWEVTIVHTKPLGDVPEELLPERKKPVQGT